MVIIEKKKGKTFAFFSLIIFIFLLIGMIGFVSASADCSLTTTYYHDRGDGYTEDTVANPPKKGEIIEDPVVYRSSDGNWQIYLSSEGYSTTQGGYGGPTWLPVFGDYDGDGLADFSVYSPSTSTFKVLASSIGYGELGATLGGPGYIPLFGNYDGDCNIPAGYRTLNPYQCTLVNGVWGDWSYGSWADVVGSTCGQDQACKQKQTRTNSRSCVTAASCGGTGCTAVGSTETATETGYVDCGTGGNYGCPFNAQYGAYGHCHVGVCMYDWYPDCDGDTFGNAASSPDPQVVRPSSGGTGCAHPKVLNNTDCNDNPSTGGASIYPGAVDICNGIDDNCENPTRIDEEGCITNAEWTDTQGNIIASLGVNKNDTVLMSIRGTNLLGKNIAISKIEKKTDNVWGQISSWLIHLFTGSSNTLSVPASSYSWIAEAGTFKFTANITKGSSIFIHSNVSNELVVWDSYNNSYPVAVITAPVNELNISNGTSIWFNQSSYDEDDLLKITWDFGDGTTKVITNYVNNPLLAGNSNYNASAAVNHNYSSSGRYIVTLTAAEMNANRGQSNSKEIFINVFSSGINVFPVILSPNNETAIQQRVVLFNASRSFVANCSLINIGSDIITSELTNKLYCKYIHRPGTKDISGYEIEMKWSINGDPVSIIRNGNWSSNYSEVVDFGEAFSKNGNHNLSLIMTYIAGPITVLQKADRDFKLKSLWKCYQESFSAYWWNEEALKVGNNCSFKEKELGDSCCPVGKICGPDGSCTGYASYCFQLKNKASCDLFVTHVPENSVNPSLCIAGPRYKSGDLYCSNVSSCFCKWDPISNKCGEGINYTKTCWKVNSTGDPDIVNTDYGECSWTTTEVIDNCNNSLDNMITKKKAVWISKDGITPQPAWCVNTEKSYQCVNTEKLPFFDNMGMIAVIVIIIAVYFYVLRRKKNILKNIEKNINSGLKNGHEKKQNKR